MAWIRFMWPWEDFAPIQTFLHGRKRKKKEKKEFKFEEEIQVRFKVLRDFNSEIDCHGYVERMFENQMLIIGKREDLIRRFNSEFYCEGKVRKELESEIMAVSNVQKMFESEILAEVRSVDVEAVKKLITEWKIMEANKKIDRARRYDEG